MKDQQRAAWALVQHGQLTYRAVADLLGLPAVEVAQLLKSVLKDFRAQDPLATT